MDLRPLAPLRHRLQAFRLGQGPGEAVEDVPAGAPGVGQGLPDDVEDQGVGDQTPGGHGLLGLEPRGGLPGHGLAEGVAGGEVAEVVGGGEEGGLGAFAAAGAAEEDEVGGGVGVGGEGVSGEVDIGESRGWGEEKGESKN